MIKLESVTKQFRSCTAVDKVSLSIDRGEYFALLGPNGAGKTTIVRMLLGFIPPTAGAITLNGIPVFKPESRRGVGYLAERHKIPGYISGRTFLLRHASLMGMARDTAVREVERVLELVSMTGKDKKPSSTYSKGMIQRFGLGAALLGSPQVLILDEPITGLDPIGVREVRTILERLREQGVSIILNSHLLSEVEKICETVGIIHKGKMLVKGPITEIVRDEDTLEDVFIKYIEKEHA